MSEANKPLCNNPKHQLKSLYFCRNCAKCAQPLQVVMYCEQCHPEFKVKHQGHANEKKQMNLAEFIGIYKKFKDDLSMQSRKWFTTKYKEINKQYKDVKLILAEFSQGVKNSKDQFKNALIPSDPKNPITRQEFEDQRYRKWLIANKFWDQVPSSVASIQREIMRLIGKILGTQREDTQDPFYFEIKLPKGGASAGDYQTEMDILRQKVQDLTKQKQLAQLFMRLTSYFSTAEIEHGFEEIKEMQGSYKQVPFLFYLAKVKIAELHAASSEKIKEILADKNFPKKTKRERQIYYYFTAMAQWKYVDDIDSEPQQTYLFYQARNKRYYKLANANNYISALNQAISIEARPIYYASKAIGYMVLGNPEKAEEYFQLAERGHFKNDAMLNNRNYNNILRKKQIQRALFRESLEERTVQYIINACRYLKEKKRYQDLKVCCQALVSKQPKNVTFRLMKFENAFKLRDKDGAKEEFASIKNLNQLDEDDLLQCERKIEALKARQNQKFGNLEDAESKYEHVAQMGYDSATNYYNYAAFLFNHRDVQEKNQKALTAINKAIEINPKNHFLKLKYMILFVSGNMQQAKKMHGTFQDPKDELKQMYEHVNDNV